MSIKAYKYRLDINKATKDKLQEVLDRCRELYNAALAERKEAWRMCGMSIGYYDQQHDLVEIKHVLRPEYQDIASHVLQDVIRRVDRSYQGFFHRIKNGETPGYPRFKGRNWYDSFTYPDHASWKLDTYELPRIKTRMVKVKLHLTKLGSMTVRMHRAMQGTIKTLTIKREGDCWYAIFTCEDEVETLPVSLEEVGIDLGVTHFAALSNGDFIDHPRYYRHTTKKLTKAQQALSRKQRGSHRRTKAVKRVAKQHRHIRNQRKDFHHKVSRKLVNRYQVVVFEDLQTRNLTKAPAPKQDEVTGAYLPNGASAKAGLNTSILDAGWYTFTQMVRVKAASAGRTVLLVNPYKTSQRCSGCGREVKKDLSERWHSCECGVELDRDTNAAINILYLGKQQLLGGTRPTLATASKPLDLV